MQKKNRREAFKSTDVVNQLIGPPSEYDANIP